MVKCSHFWQIKYTFVYWIEDPSSQCALFGPTSSFQFYSLQLSKGVIFKGDAAEVSITY